MTDRHPTVFIGSSSESLDVVRAIEYHLGRVATVTAWPEAPVPTGSTVIEWLVKQVNAFDFAVLIFAPDDVSVIRGQSSPIVRDNVIFELGLFMGRLGRERTFIVQEHGTSLTLPSDLRSVIPAFYERRDDGNWKSSLSVASATIKDGVRSLGAFRGPSRDHDEFSMPEKVARLRIEIESRGFHPDLIMGISRGGLAPAALLSQQIGGAPKVPTMALSKYPGFNNRFNRIAFDRDTFDSTNDVIQILIIDDVCDTGRTLQAARSYVASMVGFPAVRIETAALSVNIDSVHPPTFFAEPAEDDVMRFGGDVERIER